jgi:hypothetical protein
VIIFHVTHFPYAFPYNHTQQQHSGLFNPKQVGVDETSGLGAKKAETNTHEKRKGNKKPNRKREKINKKLRQKGDKG